MRKPEILRLLPAIYQRTTEPSSPLDALAGAIETLTEPLEKQMAELDGAFDPHRCPDAFVPFLARWVDVMRLFHDSSQEAETAPTGLGRLRESTALAARASQWRGTGRQLRQVLETAIGVPGFEIEEKTAGPDGTARPFHLRIRVPRQAAAHGALIERIVGLEKPAYVTFDLVFSS